MISFWVILSISLWVRLATDAEMETAVFFVSGSTNILFILVQALRWSMERVLLGFFVILLVSIPRSVKQGCKSKPDIKMLRTNYKELRKYFSPCWSSLMQIQYSSTSGIIVFEEVMTTLCLFIGYQPHICPKNPILVIRLLF